MTLKSFPRGGKKPLNKKQLENQPLNKNVKSKKHKRNQDDKEKETFNAETNLYDSTAERLSNATLREGLIVLGRIYESTEYDLLVSLPGGIVGRVQVTDISESYTNLLQNIVKTENDENETKSEFKSLPELYSPGDYVVCYVKSVQPQEKWQVALSLEPRLVNQNVDPNYLNNGCKTICVVSSIEDHGYVVDTGMVSARGFIPSKEVNAGKSYFPGKQLLCSILEIKKSENASTMKLSAKKKHVVAVDTDTIESLDALMPGTRLTLDVQKVLPNGLQVSFGENYTGYINQLYLEHPLSMYSSGLEVTGTLLYVSPTIKFAYFSLLTDKSKRETLDTGEVVGKATVLFREGNGIVLQLTKSGLRGFVPLKRTDVDYTKINEKFTSGSKHKCRVLSYNWIEGVYVCTMQHQLLEQKYFSLGDFEPGEVVKVRIRNINSQSGFITVQIPNSKLFGYVAPEHVSDSGLSALKKLNVDDEIEGRVLGIDSQKNKLKFTLKKSLVKSSLPILHNILLAKPGEQYEGTVVQINKNGLLVKFYDEVKGWLPREVLGKEGADANWNYSIGQTIRVKIQSVEASSGKMILNLPTKDTEEKEEAEDTKLFIGDQVEGTVTDSSVQGVYLRINKDDGKKVITGFLPAGNISPCMEVASLLASKYMPGDTMTALVFATMPSLILTRTFLPQEEYRNFSTLSIGDCIPCLIKDVAQDGLRVILPVVGCPPLGFVPYNRVSNFNLLGVNQMLFAKIISINKKEKQLGLTMQLKKIYDNVSDPKTKMMVAVDVLSLHFHKLSELAQNSFYKSRPISSAKLGQKVSGTIQKKTDDGLVVELENNLLGIVRKDHYTGNLKVGDKVTGKILWINYVHEIVDLTLIPSLINSINEQQSGLENLPVGTLFRSEILMVTNWFILIILKGQYGKGSLAALPARRHLNDLQPDLSPYAVRSKLRCYVIFNRDESDMIPICMLKSAFETSGHSTEVKAKSKQDKNLKRKSTSTEQEETSSPPKKKKVKSEVIEISDSIETSKPNKKKRKKDAKTVSESTSNDEEKLEEVKEEPESNETLSSKKKKRKKNVEPEKVEENVPQNDDADKSDEVQVLEESEEENLEDSSDDCVEIVKKPNVPECGFYWDDKPDLKLVPTVESSSDSEEEVEQQPKQKKKLNAAERREQERQKEREIRQREEALASNLLPNSVDQFDRLVLASPDSSLIWLQYMAYHLQATEIEKARAVARRAIKTISFREENEKLNVWNAWLNLESKFGTPESLNDVFQEAVRTNDALKVYMHMLTVHAEAGRQIELEKTVNTMIGKFKQNPQVWIDCGAALLKIGLKDKSRHIMQRGLQSLPASHHVNLMVRFANLENKFGDKERSQTLFEQILTSYPKRVDVWSSYVDSLVKSGDIEIARKVLDRAVVQTLPARKMKSLFKKYINFEEQHGTPENVSRVQQLAAEYVEKEINKEGV